MNPISLISLSCRYAIAVLTTYVLASLCSTQSVVASLAGMGIALTWTERLHMSGHDLLGLTGSFLPLTAAGFAIALPVASWLGRRRPAWRRILLALAGATAVIAIHLALRAAFGITPMAGARSLPGLITQALTGATGGYVFAVSRRHAGLPGRF
jgi:hypothetical protein